MRVVCFERLVAVLGACAALVTAPLTVQAQAMPAAVPALVDVGFSGLGPPPPPAGGDVVAGPAPAPEIAAAAAVMGQKVAAQAAASAAEGSRCMMYTFLWLPSDVDVVFLADSLSRVGNRADEFLIPQSVVDQAYQVDWYLAENLRLDKEGLRAARTRITVSDSGLGVWITSYDPAACSAVSQPAYAAIAAKRMQVLAPVAAGGDVVAGPAPVAPAVKAQNLYRFRLAAAAAKPEDEIINFRTNMAGHLKTIILTSHLITGSYVASRYRGDDKLAAQVGWAVSAALLDSATGVFADWIAGKTIDQATYINYATWTLTKMLGNTLAVYAANRLIVANEVRADLDRVANARPPHFRRPEFANAWAMMQRIARDARDRAYAMIAFP